MSTWAQENKKHEKLHTALRHQKRKTDEDNAFLRFPLIPVKMERSGRILA
jgi:hypothetical protein